MRGFLIFIFLVSCSHQVKIISPVLPETRSRHEAFSRGEMVTSQGEATTQAALSMFSLGGNIIDAFVAASFTISVERPHSTGIGGGGFLLYYSKKDKKTYAFDFREVAPLMAVQNMYLTKKGDTQPLLSQEGALAVANPGLVRGLFEIHQRFGKLSWSKTLTPAITLAREGLPLYQELSVALADRRDLLSQDEEIRKIFLMLVVKSPK